MSEARSQRRGRSLKKRAARWWLLVLLGPTACLPEGDPPAGTRLLEERHLGGVRFSPAPGENVLYTRRAGYQEQPYQSVSPIHDLWTIPARGGPSARLVEDVAWEFLPLADSAGRLVVAHNRLHAPNTGQVGRELTLIDPAGARIALGRVFDARLSPGRTRLYYQKEEDGAQVVREADGRETALGSSPSYDTRFAGETLVFTRIQELWALPPDATQPVLLAPRFRSWTAKVTPGDPQIVAFSQPGEMRGAEPKPMSLLLIRGGSSRVLMMGTFLPPAVFAPSDDRIAVIERLEDSGRLRLHVFHADSEGHETHDLTAPGTLEVGRFSSLTVAFRPGTREIWCFVGGPGLRIVRDDGSLLALPDMAPPDVNVEPWPFDDPTRALDHQPEMQVIQPGYTPPLFTTDGRFWLYRQNASVFLGRADQPQLPGLLIQDRHDFPLAQVRELGDGRRMLIWAAPSGDAGRWALTLLDPETNQRRLLATSMGPSAVGKRRIVAMTNLSGTLGDLRLIDLETGQDTLLAQNVTGFAVPTPCAACDPTAPGAPVAYVVHARIPFKYDGLWRLELP